MNMPNLLTVQIGEEETLRMMQESLTPLVAVDPNLELAMRALECQFMAASRALEVARDMANHVLTNRMDLAFGCAELFAEATEGMWGPAK